MAAAAPFRAAAPSARRPGLRLVPQPRRRARRRRMPRRVMWSLPDSLYAVTVAMLLATGIVGVLLLNTSIASHR